MTIEEAINYITYHGFISDDVKDMAIAALEKQSPKVEFQGEHRKCICGSFAVGEYCFKCGQKIDWSVEE